MPISMTVETVKTVKLSKSDVEAALASHAGLPKGTVLIAATVLSDGCYAIIEDRNSDFQEAIGATDEHHERWALSFQDTILSQLDQQAREQTGHSLTADRAAHLIRALRKQIAELSGA